MTTGDSRQWAARAGIGRGEETIVESPRRLYTSLAIAASLPLWLFAYLGSFSRMMADDYGLFATALKLSGRSNFRYWWENWFGSYSFILLGDVLAPLGAASIPSIFPALVILSWLLGTAWLARLALLALALDSRRASPFALLIGCLMTAAAANALYTWEPLYYYSASARYALPVGILLILLAFMWEAARKPRPRLQIGLAAIALGGACFANAGLSEMQAVHQVMLLTGILAGVFLLISPGPHTRLRLLAASAWCGSALSLVVQLLSPGLTRRVQFALQRDWLPPLHDLNELIPHSLATTFGFLAHPPSVLGFLLLLAAGAALMLGALEPAPPLAYRRRLRAAALVSLAVVVAFTVVPVVMGLRSIGIVYARVLTPVPLLQALSGLIVGVALGVEIRYGSQRAWMGRRGQTRLTILACIAAALISASIVVNQLRLLPSFSIYAQEWDARHRRISELSAKGERVIEVAPYSFDLTAFLAESGISFGGNYPYYYGVDKIVVLE